MAGLESAHNRRGDDRITTQPGQSNLRLAHAALRRDHADRLDNFLIARRRRFGKLGGARLGFGAGSRLAPGPGQTAACQRTIKDCLHAFVRAERQHLPLFLAGKQIVGVLH